VLVVEDEPLIRMNAVSTVEDAGYVAIEAADADAAIAILESRDDIRVVFTDINMPGSMDGLRLARAIRNRWPPIRLIVTSGLIRPKEGEFPADGRFLPKPYAADHLAAVLRELAA